MLKRPLNYQDQPEELLILVMFLHEVAHPDKDHRHR